MEGITLLTFGVQAHIFQGCCRRQVDGTNENQRGGKITQPMQMNKKLNDEMEKSSIVFKE